MQYLDKFIQLHLMFHSEVNQKDMSELELAHWSPELIALIDFLEVLVHCVWFYIFFVLFSVDVNVPCCFLTNSTAYFLKGIWAQAGVRKIWAHKRLKFGLFDCFSCVVGPFTIGLARRIWSELALAGGREGV